MYAIITIAFERSIRWRHKLALSWHHHLRLLQTIQSKWRFSASLFLLTSSFFPCEEAKEGRRIVRRKEC